MADPHEDLVAYNRRHIAAHEAEIARLASDNPDGDIPVLPEDQAVLDARQAVADANAALIAALQAADDAKVAAAEQAKLDAAEAARIEAEKTAEERAAEARPAGYVAPNPSVPPPMRRSPAYDMPGNIPPRPTP